MAQLAGDGAEVNARIVYWGIEGAGKTTNLRVIHSKLRPDHRGELEEVPTRLDPTVAFHVLPIKLGEVGGVPTRIRVSTVPSGPEQAPTRKQLLDEVDGLVFVVDTTRERLADNLACFEELREALAAYGRPLEEVPLVIQYNKRDLSDPFALEELHRKLHMRGVAAFEAVAKDGTAVLQTLTTISKRVIRSLRESPRAEADAPAPPPGVSRILEQAAAPAPKPLPPAAPQVAVSQIPPAPPSSAVDPALLAPAAEETGEVTSQAASLFEPEYVDARQEPAAAPEGPYEIAEVGHASRADAHTVRLPVVLADRAGHRLSVTLSVRVDPGESGVE